MKAAVCKNSTSRGRITRGRRRCGASPSVSIWSWLGLVVAVGACATFANTPEQTVAYERWARCSGSTVTLESISVDGRIRFFYTNPVDRRDVTQCVSEAGRTGPALPPPVGIGPRGGP
jgi:hypothetical protein